MQNATYRTNVGVMETSGTTTVCFQSLQHSRRHPRRPPPPPRSERTRAINSILSRLNVTASDARVDVTVTSALGSVLPYASVVSNRTNDAMFVPAIRADDLRESAFVLPEALSTGDDKTDLRLFNTSTSTATAQLQFVPSGVNQAMATKEVSIAPGSSMMIADAVRSLFGLTTLRARSGHDIDRHPIVSSAQTYRDTRTAATASRSRSRNGHGAGRVRVRFS